MYFFGDDDSVISSDNSLSSSLSDSDDNISNSNISNSKIENERFKRNAIKIFFSVFIKDWFKKYYTHTIIKFWNK